LQPLFDGHNDVLISATADAIADGRDGGHLDVPRMRAGGFGGGIFAVFTPTPGEEHVEFTDDGYDVPLAEPVSFEHATAHVERAVAGLLDLHARGALRLVQTAIELDVAREAGEIAAVLSFEGAEAIDPGLERLDAWYERGLRALGPVWSRPNAFAHGVPFRFRPRRTRARASPTPAGRSCGAATSSA
jgi:membrane dipeptidase